MLRCESHVRFQANHRICLAAKLRSCPHRRRWTDRLCSGRLPPDLMPGCNHSISSSSPSVVESSCTSVSSTCCGEARTCLRAAFPLSLGWPLFLLLDPQAVPRGDQFECRLQLWRNVRRGQPQLRAEVGELPITHREGGDLRRADFAPTRQNFPRHLD